MKTLKIIFLLIVSMQMMNMEAFSQCDSFVVSAVVLKNTKTNKTVTIKQDEYVTLFLKNETKIKGNIILITDTSILIGSESINFDQISKLKYRDGIVANIKDVGKWVTIELALFSATGFIIMIAAPGELPPDMWDMSDLQLFGYCFFLMGLLDIPQFIPIWMIPYQCFNMVDKWKIEKVIYVKNKIPKSNK